MIRTESDYQSTRNRLQQLRSQLTAQETQLRSEGLPDDQIKRALDPMRSFVSGLEDELETYVKLQRGDLSTIGELVNLHRLGRTLVALRIVCGMTQRALADKLKVDESQISRWEKNEYHGITVEKAAKILDALGVRARTICDESELLKPA